MNRQQLVVDHIHIANGLAKKRWEKIGRKIEWHDMRAEALYALCKAARFFDKSRGVPFAPFASMCISRHLIQVVAKSIRSVKLDKLIRAAAAVA